MHDFKNRDPVNLLAVLCQACVHARVPCDKKKIQQMILLALSTRTLTATCVLVLQEFEG